TSASTLIGGSETWWPFLIILLLVFGLFLILAGLFTAYFGSGKSRSIGVALLVVGLVVGLGSAYWYHAGIATPGSGVPALFDLIGQAFLVILAAAVGALIAIAIFLVAIMKS
ncbi:MAG TPA: hypothetical protein VLX64_06380, partial [Thermoplasmata archaeon]|nr:hypothetical protein [Thermoplasmata archaeon]